MTLEEIKELIQVVLDSGVAELEVTRGDDKVRIRRDSPATVHEVMLPAHAAPHGSAHGGAPPAAGRCRTGRR